MSFSFNFTQSAWWGKCLGAFLGFLVAGPPGALMGIFIGNFFDRGLNAHSARPHGLYHAEKRKVIKQAFQKATFLTMGHICKTDGRVSEAEIQFTQHLIHTLRLNKTDQKLAKQSFTQGKSEAFNLNQPLQLLHKISMSNPRLIHAFLQIQYQTAQVEGLTNKKVSVLNHILSALNLAPLHEQAHARETFYTHFNQSAHTHQQRTSSHTSSHPLESAYTLLNVSQSASKTEVKRAYRKQMSLYHPDKYMAKGYSEAEIKQANEKTQAIRKAYDAICTQNNW